MYTRGYFHADGNQSERAKEREAILQANVKKSSQKLNFIKKIDFKTRILPIFD